MKLSDRLRDALGRAHYDRMRLAMLEEPGWDLPVWEDLSEGAREVHRERLDYAVPTVVEALVDAVYDLEVA